jgi:hypothetical protein
MVLGCWVHGAVTVMACTWIWVTLTANGGHSGGDGSLEDSLGSLNSLGRRDGLRSSLTWRTILRLWDGSGSQCQ